MIVVGAGLTGLAIARRLRVYGVDVTVVEAEPAIGGQCRSEVVDGFKSRLHLGRLAQR